MQHLTSLQHLTSFAKQQQTLHYPHPAIPRRYFEGLNCETMRRLSQLSTTTKCSEEAAAPSPRELKMPGVIWERSRLGTLPPPPFFLPSFPSPTRRLGGLRASAPVNRAVAPVTSLRPRRRRRRRSARGQGGRHGRQPRTAPARHSPDSALRHPCLRK